MDLDMYQNEARRTAPRTIEAYPEALRQLCELAKDAGLGDAANAVLKIHDILIWGQGNAGEAGESCDILKKVFGHGKALDEPDPQDPKGLTPRQKLRLELGDQLWYIANLADAFGFPLSDIARGNVDKLRARHPNGFTIATANAKVDEGASAGLLHAPTTFPGESLAKHVSKAVGTGPIGWDGNGTPSEGA